jgi:polar amino acid transport system substrate-binding protein
MKRNVVATTSDGRFTVIEQPVPDLEPGMVLVEVRAALVSPGSNLRGGWRAFAARRGGPAGDAPPNPLGYANSGVVLDVGDGVESLDKGDRVACIGGGYALASNYAVVPHRLCIRLPDAVSHEDGAYGMLGATALHALRRGAPGLGEFVAVVGLGIVGQLTARLYQLAGNYVIGWDTIPFRVRLAEGWGIDTAVLVGTDDEIEATGAFTGGRGLDGAVLAFGGDGNQAVRALGRCMKVAPDGHPMGTIVVVGNPNFEYRSHEAGMTNIDIRRASRVGPGYHDDAWERGADYPPVFMRWTTRTNLELTVRLIAERKLQVSALTTHTIPMDRVEQDTPALLDDPDQVLGVVFTN